MTFTWRRGLASLGALALVACGAQGEPSTTTGAQPPVESHVLPARPAVPVLEWAPCGEEFPGVECAVAEVPLDYDRPRGEKTFIALARIPASDRDNRIGSLFVNPGGPGGSGVETVLYWGGWLHALLQGRYDLVGFDPRGVGRSDPFQCWDSADDFNAWYATILDFPWLREQERPLFDALRAVYPWCLARPHRILHHMSTADVARDMDLLRLAVGDSRLNYLGWSYGSFLGQTYANLFPGKVGAFVLDGVLDPRLWSSGLEIISWRYATEREFAEFLRLCDESGPAHCRLARPEGARARWEAILASLLVKPWVTPDGWEINYALMVKFGFLAMYDATWWGGDDGWAAVIADFGDAILGDAVAVERALAGLGALRARMEAPFPLELEYANGFEAQLSNFCADAEYPSNLATFSAVGRFAAHDSTFGPAWWWPWVPCTHWPVAPDRYTGPWRARTSSPVLLVGNLYDGVTAYEDAVAVSRLLPNSRLLTYAGWGHTAIGYTACVDERVAAFLLDGTLPPEGTVCPANENPFLVPRPTLRALPARPPIVRPPAWMLPHLPR